MGNSLRCCLACILPCGALDVIRIVHLNGCVEEITRPVTAGEILKDNPNHVLSKPCAQGVGRRILILSPDSELKRGSIYFLIPASTLPSDKKKSSKNTHKSTKRPRPSKKSYADVASDCDRYLKDAVSSSQHSGKHPSSRERRTGRSGVWQPHLQSIAED
ncbi:hypothetical protein K2173_016837 [Erythroxylum novogranatense]|uniref:6,7-dimethyl-8-ribityllumazine synthase n=1 Tax=Erythroxylum novogranatense TaxID=1862640 RepID=A0AAV8SHF2_9ROSI|nr:hypothetical protein K2173_016837 [Erythroxylum novogranatense]